MTHRPYVPASTPLQCLVDLRDRRIDRARLVRVGHSLHCVRRGVTNALAEAEIRNLGRVVQSELLDLGDDLRALLLQQRARFVARRRAIHYRDPQVAQQLIA